MNGSQVSRPAARKPSVGRVTTTQADISREIQDGPNGPGEHQPRLDYPPYRSSILRHPTKSPQPADPEGVHRALLNVVGNALDAVEDGKHPHVVVATQREGGDDDGEWVRVVVADNGTGIPPEKMADIFRPFVSTKGARGTGLGLAVSRKILREHGGDILVQSVPGKGSRFVLLFPVSNPSVGDQTLNG